MDHKTHDSDVNVADDGVREGDGEDKLDAGVGLVPVAVGREGQRTGPVPDSGG